MGCCWSKTERCLRCNRIGDDLELNINHICQKCIQGQQLGEFRRRLAALRDENSSATVPASTKQIYLQTRQPNDVPQRPALRSLPHYTVTRKTSVTRKRSSQRRHNNNAKPLYGEYKCAACRREWSSCRSWRDMYQKCEKCGVNVYPYLQRPLQKDDKAHSDNPHLQHLCQKCIKLGYYCGDYRRNHNNRRNIN